MGLAAVLIIGGMLAAGFATGHLDEPGELRGRSVRWQIVFGVGIVAAFAGFVFATRL